MLRTCINGVNKVNGKFGIKFQTFRITNLGTGEQHVAFECESPALFDTEFDAFIAGGRALDVLERTGKFPNMCVPF
jgi:hypothetical protein